MISPEIPRDSFPESMGSEVPWTAPCAPLTACCFALYLPRTLTCRLSQMGVETTHYRITYSSAPLCGPQNTANQG